jgi:phosphoribosyl 1,2-cyclic phosphodiesterase
MGSGVPQTSDIAMEVRIWGARGSVPTPAAENLQVGGNTSCVEVLAGTGERFIFDAGTGIRNLGLAEMQSAEQQRDLHIFLTHFNWDHLQGLPFFTAALFATEFDYIPLRLRGRASATDSERADDEPILPGAFRPACGGDAF